MSTDTPTRGHRHTRSVATPGIAASSQNPRNPHHLNQHAYTRNGQPDVKNYNSDQTPQPSTPPRTPRKDNQSSSQNVPNSAASGTGAKQKSRNKNRPKNVMTSPITTRTGRNTSPFTGAHSAAVSSSTKPLNTPSAAAYAGPTFHASPAPSALPIPSFYSKSVPESPGAKGLKSLKSPPLATPPHVAPPANKFQREESPLDFFFKADREEKARAHSASQAATTAGPFPPPSVSSRQIQTPPTSSSQIQNRPVNANRLSSGGIFAMELDGEREAGTPYGPAFSTPYSERINAVRPNQPNRSAAQQSPGVQMPSDKSEALKAYLFSGLPPKSEENSTHTSPNHFAPNGSKSSAQFNGPKNAGLPHRPNQNGHQYSLDGNHQNNNSRIPGRSSNLRQEVTPTKTPTRIHERTSTYSNSPNPSRTYQNGALTGMSQANKEIHGTSPSSFGVSSEQRSADLLGIEDSLRKILKLDSGSSSGASVGSQPKAVASVTNYVGGRPPPKMNGMHNGVMGS